MKLNNLPLIRKRMAILGVSAAVAAGTAQAQFTGIGTTAPSATLDVVTADTATQEPLQIETIRNLHDTPDSLAAYNEVLVYNSGTGLFRREEITDLLDDNGEWVYDVATNTLAPRRADVAGGLTIDGSTGAEAVGIGFATTVNNTFTVGAFASQLGGTLGVTGNTSLGADLAVTGNSALGGTLGVTGVTTLSDALNIDQADVPNANTPTAIDGTERLLLQDGSDLVQYVTIDDMLSNASYWQFDAGTNTLRPADADITDEVIITDGTVTVGNDLAVTTNATVGGTLGVTGNTSLGADLAVTGNSTLTGTLGVAGATTLDDVLNVDQGDMTDLNGTPIDGTEHILMQENGSDLVGYVTVNDLISNASYWQFDAGTNTLRPADADITDEVIITDGTVTVGNDLAVTTNATVGGTLGVTGNTSLGADLAVTGNSTLTGTLAANGASTFNSTVEIGSAGADQLTLANLAQVNTTTEDRSGNDPAVDASGPYERVLVTDGDGVVRYITADDLLASSGEWVWSDADASGGWNTGDAVYLRRNGELDGGGNDVYVDFGGNMVLDVANAYQFGDATNQVEATGITSSAGYFLNTADGNDVSFTEAGAGNPWLYFAAADAGDDNGRVGIGTNAPLASLHVQGNIIASHTAQTSDERFKRDIEEFTGALDAINAVRGVSYTFRAEEFPSERFDDAEHLGFIAQELREVLPQTVFEREDGYLTVDYSALTPVLAEAIQELSAKVASLEAENASLKAGPAVGAADVISKLEARIADLDARLEEVAGRK